jgi:cellulose synthase/poly-beta-1,6-N-acetylglucosamine synthase-like glycosyltransferase
LVAVSFYNWFLWQKDKKTLATGKTLPPRLPLTKWPALPPVSVLVAAWNEAAHIERHIGSFLKLRYPHKELIICAGGTDTTYNLAQQYAGEMVRVLRQEPGEGKQRALARSLPHSRGDIIFLTDADCLLDDDAFERTLYPVASGLEQVCTGGSQPLPEQLTNPFVLPQAAVQLVSSLRTADYAPGLLGRNCAVERSLLVTSEGLLAPAATGTDYVLTKMLVQSGANIRQLPTSRVFTSFPTTAASYVRQQRRWLRNVALHGQRFGATGEVRASLRTSLLGLVMLLLPVLALLLAFPLLLLFWLLLVWHAFWGRMRALHFFTVLYDISPKQQTVFNLPLLILLDFVAWSQPLLDYLSTARQKEW